MCFCCLLILSDLHLNNIFVGDGDAVGTRVGDFDVSFTDDEIRSLSTNTALRKNDNFSLTDFSSNNTGDNASLGIVLLLRLNCP